MTDDLKVGYVIPTLGGDLRLLERAVQSVRSQEYACELVIVGPDDSQELTDFCNSKDLAMTIDKREGIANAFNIGVNFLAEQGVEIFGTLGEDDELLQGSTASLMRAFKDPKVVAAVGRIWYVNSRGEVIFHNRAYPELAPILHWIPNVIPNPGALSRISIWKTVGGFDTSLKFAMDIDYWLKVRKIGKIQRVEAPMSLFRWHSAGGTAGLRSASLKEGSKLRSTYSPPALRWLFRIIDPLLVWLGERRLKSAMKKDFIVN